MTVPTSSGGACWATDALLTVWNTFPPTPAMVSEARIEKRLPLTVDHMIHPKACAWVDSAKVSGPV